jgi:hypothetical protein
MNMRSLTVLFCSVSALILSACIITGTGSGGVGGGTTGGTGGEGTTVTSGGVGGGTTTGSTSTGMACDAKYKCSEAITPPDGDPTKICDMTESATLYDAYYACSCTKDCKTDCGNNACAGKASSDACKTCVQGKCKAQFDACANDL